MQAKLVLVSGKADKEEIAVNTPMILGRQRDADLVIIHKSVSRHHCRIEERDGQLVVRDNNSSNGTYINDQRITESVLNPGDELTVGPLTFRAQYDAAGTGVSGVGVAAGVAMPAEEDEEVLDLSSFNFDESGSTKMSQPTAPAESMQSLPPADDDDAFAFLGEAQAGGDEMGLAASGVQLDWGSPDAETEPSLYAPEVTGTPAAEAEPESPDVLTSGESDNEDFAAWASEHQRKSMETADTKIPAANISPEVLAQAASVEIEPETDAATAPAEDAIDFLPPSVEPAPASALDDQELQGDSSGIELSLDDVIEDSDTLKSEQVTAAPAPAPAAAPADDDNGWNFDFLSEESADAANVPEAVVDDEEFALETPPLAEPPTGSTDEDLASFLEAETPPATPPAAAAAPPAAVPAAAPADEEDFNAMWDAVESDAPVVGGDAVTEELVDSDAPIEIGLDDLADSNTLPAPAAPVPAAPATPAAAPAEDDAAFAAMWGADESPAPPAAAPAMPEAALPPPAAAVPAAAPAADDDADFAAMWGEPAVAPPAAVPAEPVAEAPPAAPAADDADFAAMWGETEAPAAAAPAEPVAEAPPAAPAPAEPAAAEPTGDSGIGSFFQNLAQSTPDDDNPWAHMEGGDANEDEGGGETFPEFNFDR